MTSWETLASEYGQHLAWAACDEHLGKALQTAEGKTIRVLHLDNPDERKCENAHAPATWLIYGLGRRDMAAMVDAMVRRADR